MNRRQLLAATVAAVTAPTTALSAPASSTRGPVYELRFQTERQAWELGCALRNVGITTREGLERCLGHICRYSCPEAYAMAAEIASAPGFALLAGILLSHEDVVSASVDDDDAGAKLGALPLFRIGGAFAQGWVGAPTPNEEPAWTQSPAHVSRLATWLRGKDYLRIYPADGAPMRVTLGPLVRRFYMDLPDDPAELAKVLSMGWPPEQLNAFWREMLTGGAA